MNGAAYTGDPLDARPSIPDGVARRAFPEETVLLNLGTGQYHGLNGSAAAMLDEIEGAATVRAAVAPLAELYDAPAGRIEDDLRRLCRALEERGLLRLDAA